jgi:hypothetical protein
VLLSDAIIFPWRHKIDNVMDEEEESDSGLIKTSQESDSGLIKKIKKVIQD